MPRRAPTIKPSILNAKTRSTVQRGGLPARSSRRLIRSACPLGLIRRPRPDSRPRAGTSTRLLNGCSRSSRIDCGAVWIAWTAASDRPTCARSDVMTPIVASRRTTPRKMPPSPTKSISWSLMSDLHLNDLAEPQRPDGDVDDEEHEEHDSEGVGPQRRDVFVSDQHEVEEEQRRQTSEDPRRQPAFGGQHAHLPAKSFPLAQGGGDGGQDLGEVATHFALDADGHDDPLEVHAAHPLRDAFEGVLDGHTKPGLHERAVELARDRLRALPNDGVNALREGVAGDQPARHQLEGVGHPLQEGAGTPTLLERQIAPGRHEPDG